jgi:PAS domain S-box-containing protein
VQISITGEQVVTAELGRALLIEAAPETARAYREVCTELGLLLAECTWPLPAALAQERFALVIIDAGLSLARASQWLRELLARERGSDVPHLVAYHPAAEDQVSALVDSGADALLSYDASSHVLRAHVQLHLRTRVAAARIARAGRSLGLLLEITQALASSTDIQEILYMVVRRTADLVQVDRVSIVLVPDDAVASGFVIAASDDKGVWKLQLDLHKYPEIRHVLQHKSALTIDDVGTHPILDGVRSSVTGLGLSSITLIPMVFETRVMGVFLLRAKAEPNALDAQQIGVCQVLANATAIALKNARILQTLQDGEPGPHTRQDAEKRLLLLKRYGDVFESSSDGIVAIDERARLLYANPGAYKLLGYDEHEFGIGTALLDIVEPGDRKRVLALTRDFLSGRFPHSLDLRVHCKNEQQMVIACAFARLHGQDSAILMSFRDVTQAHKLQEELMHTRNFLGRLIEASVDAIVAADLRGRIILFNAGAERLYGYKREDVVNKLSVAQLYPGDGARNVMRMLGSEERGGVGRLEPVRTEALDRSGQVFPISLTAATIYENGKAVATFGIFTDLRERVRVEEQLAQAQEKLELNEKHALLIELAGATAHELNQPLTSVMGYADLLVRKLDAASPAYRAATVIQNQSQRMAEIVRNIGRLTRYETKSYVGEQRILDLDRASARPSEPPGSDPASASLEPALEVAEINGADRR